MNNLLTLKEYAGILRISTQTLYNDISTRRYRYGRPKKVGSRIRYERSELEKVLA